MADISKLKTQADKGAPPPPQRRNDNLKRPTRGPTRAKAKIEFSVPSELRDEFALEAGRRFGFKKGAKSDLFIALWDEYKRRITG